MTDTAPAPKADNTAPATRVLRCPHCLSQNLKGLGGVFVEDGEWDSEQQRYTNEGNGDHWACLECGRGFIEFDPATPPQPDSPPPAVEGPMRCFYVDLTGLAVMQTRVWLHGRSRQEIEQAARRFGLSGDAHWKYDGIQGHTVDVVSVTEVKE